MPVYDYKCRKCGETFELKLGLFHNRKAVKCPKCGEDEPQRIYSTPGIYTSGGSCSTRSRG
jgi:putative FmdB family regulatory protein